MESTLEKHQRHTGRAGSDVVPWRGPVVARGPLADGRVQFDEIKSRPGGLDVASGDRNPHDDNNNEQDGLFHTCWIVSLDATGWASTTKTVVCIFRSRGGTWYCDMK